MRLHCLGLPHAVTNLDYISCAYTQKVLKFIKMMKGHDMVHYGNPGATVDCEHVDLVNKDEWAVTKYSKIEEYKNKFFDFDTSDDFHKLWHKRCIEAVRRRLKPNETNFLLCFWGWGHRPTADGFTNSEIIKVEPGIGYNDVWAGYKIFESYSHMHYVYGRYFNDAKGGKIAACFMGNESWYDRVIPNYFDSTDFVYSDQKEDFFLYLGRIVECKGVGLAAKMCQTAGKKLVVAGQGGREYIAKLKEKIPNIEYVGFADKEKRADLMSRAKALICPTYYVEPFGGVSIEALLSGTPVITVDWGVFTETIKQGVSGFRCRNFNQFLKAVQDVEKLKPASCRLEGLKFSLENVRPQYEEYFESLKNINNKNAFYDGADTLVVRQ